MKHIFSSLVLWSKDNKKSISKFSIVVLLFNIIFAMLWIITRSDYCGILFTVGIFIQGVPSFLLYVAEILYKEKTLDEMTLNEKLELIISTDYVLDWDSLYAENTKIVIYRKDTHLKFKHHDDRDIQNQNFIAKWANKFPDPKAVGYYFHLYHYDTIIHSFVLVYVDGCRALLPVPKSHTELTVSRLDYAAAVINGDKQTTDSYMERAGITINAGY